MTIDAKVRRIGGIILSGVACCWVISTQMAISDLQDWKSRCIEAHPTLDNKNGSITVGGSFTVGRLK